MKTNDTHNNGRSGNDAVRQVSRRQAIRIPVVTQDLPDDLLADEGPMHSTSGDEAPTQRELEQDVMTTNPSIESMDSRG